MRLLVAALIVAMIVAVAVDNRNEAEVGDVVGEVNPPLWVVLVAAGIAGVVVGWLIKHNRQRRNW